jgi:hypothetical protein
MKDFRIDYGVCAYVGSCKLLEDMVVGWRCNTRLQADKYILLEGMNREFSSFKPRKTDQEAL